MDINTILKKYDSFNLTLVEDENDKNKCYIVLDGYVIGVQYNF